MILQKSYLWTWFLDLLGMDRGERGGMGEQSQRENKNREWWKVHMEGRASQRLFLPGPQERELLGKEKNCIVLGEIP